MATSAPAAGLPVPSNTCPPRRTVLLIRRTSRCPGGPARRGGGPALMAVRADDGPADSGQTQCFAGPQCFAGRRPPWQAALAGGPGRRPWRAAPGRRPWLAARLEPAPGMAAQARPRGADGPAWRSGRAVAALRACARRAGEPGAGRRRISAAARPVPEVRCGWRRAGRHLRSQAMQLNAAGRVDYRFSGRAPLEWMSCSGSWRNARQYQCHPSGYRPTGYGRPYFSRSNRAAGYCHVSASAHSGRRSRQS